MTTYDMYPFLRTCLVFSVCRSAVLEKQPENVERFLDLSATEEDHGEVR